MIARETELRKVEKGMALFLALDGGGTKTRCWVADETRVLGAAAGATDW